MTDSTGHAELTNLPLPPPRRLSRFVVLGLLALFVVGGAIVFFVVILPKMHGEAKAKGPAEAGNNLPSVELVEDDPEVIVIPRHVRKALGIEESFTVKSIGKDDGKPLTMPGSTALDPNRIRRVRARFNAEVTKITQKKGRGIDHDIRPDDRVEMSESLAEIWSLEIGMRKSDLADAVVQLQLDKQRLKERIELWRNGNLPLDLLNQTRRDVITDQNSVDRAERNLLVWNVPYAEIAEVIKEAEAEASEVSVREGGLSKAEKEERFKRWARSTLTAPIAGTIIESNIGGKGEYLADSTVNLFTIADVDRLLVLAYPSEDQLPELTRLAPEDLNWTIKTVGLGDQLKATDIEGISYILDPNTRTPVVKGYIINPDRKLRAGQFLTASVKMPPPADVVEIPLSAIAEDGRQSFVFVQSPRNKDEYIMRRVVITRRFEDTAYVRSKLTKEDEKLNAEEEQFKITGGVLASLSASKVPDELLEKLADKKTGLKDKEFKSQDEFWAALGKILDKGDLEKYKRRLLVFARQGPPPREPLLPEKDQLLMAGVLELRAAMDDLMSKK